MVHVNREKIEIIIDCKKNFLYHNQEIQKIMESELGARRRRQCTVVDCVATATLAKRVAPFSSIPPPVRLGS